MKGWALQSVAVMGPEGTEEKDVGAKRAVSFCVHHVPNPLPAKAELIANSLQKSTDPFSLRGNTLRVVAGSNA